MRQPQQGLSVLGRIAHAVRPEVVDVVSHSHSEVSQHGRSRILQSRGNLLWASCGYNSSSPLVLEGPCMAENQL